MDRWSLPDTLADEVLSYLHVGHPTDLAGVTDLIEEIGQRIPRGSSSKRSALDEGRRPEGDDPQPVAEAWLAGHQASWTCWAMSAVAAALIRAGGNFEADVRGVRRVGDDAPPVDVHSVVAITDDAGDTWVTDPYFGLGPVPEQGGSWQRPLLYGELTSLPDRRFHWSASSPQFTGSTLPYVSLTGPLGPADVRMFCDISVTHSGLPTRPFATLLLADGCASLRTTKDDDLVLQVWHASTEPTTTWPDSDLVQVSSWADGMAALHATAARSRSGTK